MSDDTATVERLRTRYECTAGFTRDIYAPDERDLDLKAADLIEQQARTIAELRRRLDEIEEAIDGEIDYCSDMGPNLAMRVSVIAKGQDKP